jgi:hypothetical protein
MDPCAEMAKAVGGRTGAQPPLPPKKQRLLGVALSASGRGNPQSNFSNGTRRPDCFNPVIGASELDFDKVQAIQPGPIVVFLRLTVSRGKS